VATSPATIKNPTYAKQGVAYRYFFTLPYYDAAANFSRFHTEVAGSVPFAVGDVKISIDGSSLANTTNLPVQLAASSQIYYIDLTAAEMLGELIYVVLVDQTTPPTFPDTAFTIITVLRVTSIRIDTLLGYLIADSDATYFRSKGTGLPVNFVPSASRATNIFDTVIGAEPTTIVGVGPSAAAVPVVWTSLVNCSLVNDYLAKIAPGVDGVFDSGAASTQQLASGDGYFTTVAVDIRVSGPTTIFGLSNGNTGVDYTKIDYAFDLFSNGGLFIFENGVNIGQFGTYALNDQLMIAVEGGQVKYKKNGTTLYTSLVAPTYPLLLLVCFQTVGALLYASRVHFAAETIPIGSTRSVGSLIQDLWYRILRKHKKVGSGSSSQVITYKEDGTTAFSTQAAIRPSGSEQIVDKSS
jgi:hypothetical protein